MTFRVSLLIVVLGVILGAAYLTYYINVKNAEHGLSGEDYRPGISRDFDKAVKQAKVVYDVKNAQGVEFADGPCLTNDLLKDWVADIVHNPKIAVDFLPENQCQAYLEGRAHHFVELDLEGNLVRVK
jgi:hypothetical protein